LPDDVHRERYCPGFSGIRDLLSRRNTAPVTGIYFVHPHLIRTRFLFRFLVNALVIEHLACRYYKQREIGCPAAQRFDKTKRPCSIRRVINKKGYWKVAGLVKKLSGS
jgi:hypothetical protein